MPGMTVSELQVKVSADTSAAERGLSSLSGKVTSVGAGIATAFGVAAVAGVAALGAGIASSVGKFAEFEAQMNILKVTTQATDEQMAAMGAAARALGSDMDLPATSSAGAATAMLELAKAGLSVDQTMAAAKGTLQLAAAAGIDEANAAQLAAGALNAFGLSGDQAATVANQLAYAANASALDATGLGQAVAQAGFIFKATGRPMEELLSSMIVLGNAGLSGSDGATALKNALMQASSPTKQASGEMEKYGISLFDAQGNMKAVPSIIDHLNDRLGKLTPETRNAALATIFQSDGMKALIPLMAAGGDKLREYEANLKTTNAASEQAQARSAGLTGAIKGLGSQWETLQETVGSKVAPAVERAIRSIAEGIGEMAAAASDADFSGLSNAIDTAVSASKEALRQLGDAWRTAKQAFAGEWLPSNDIPPFVNAVGLAATKLGEFTRTVESAVEMAGRMGAWKDVASGLGILSGAVQTADDRLKDITRSLDALRGPADRVVSTADMIAAGLKGAALGFQYAALQVEGFVDTIGSAVDVGINYVTGLSKIGEALNKLKSGDLPGAWEALKDGNAAFARGEEAAEGFRVRALDRVGDGARIMGQMVTNHLTSTAASVETNMAAANAAVAEGSSGWQAAMEVNGASTAAAAESSMATVSSTVETGMATSTAAVESGGASMAAATESAGASMVAGLEGQMPALASAAESGASGAVAAVEGQAGAASAAGSSVGSSIGQGLLAGIGAYVGSVAAKAASMVSEAIGAARAAADAQSPSRKTMKLGEDMAEGLEIGLSKSDLGEEMKAKIRDFIASTREYIPVASHIASLENEIKDVRDKAQTDALFRQQEMITLDSETLRLKEATVRLDRDSIGVRQDLARATREITDAERGTLADRTATIEIDAKRKAIRLETLELEKQLLTVHKNSDRTEFIKKQIEALRDQDRLLGIEAERITTTNSLATTAARVRREQLDDQVRGIDSVIGSIKEQIETLDAERAVVNANEAIIKNATENEVSYRERLIAVFKSESAPLRDRIAAGLALVDQLAKEGGISKELADKLREEAKQAGAATTATSGLGGAASIAAPALSTAANQTDRMAEEAAQLAHDAARAKGDVLGLANALGGLGKSGGGGFNFQFGGAFAGGGHPPVGVASLVGEKGPELFVPDRPGTVIPADVTRSWMGGGGGQGGMQTLTIDVAVGGKVAKQIVIEGYDLAVGSGWAPGGLTG